MSEGTFGMVSRWNNIYLGNSKCAYLFCMRATHFFWCWIYFPEKSQSSGGRLLFEIWWVLIFPVCGGLAIQVGKFDKFCWINTSHLPPNDVVFFCIFCASRTRSIGAFHKICSWSVWRHRQPLSVRRIKICCIDANITIKYVAEVFEGIGKPKVFVGLKFAALMTILPLNM